MGCCLFYATRICIPQGFIHQFVIEKLYGGGLAGHIKHDQTHALIIDQFY